MKFLIFGDVVGRPGREAVKRALPELKREYQPDSVIVNIENIASTGMGVSVTGFADALSWAADAYTTGDHAWDNKKGVAALEAKDSPAIRPANYPTGVPGRGWRVFTSGAWQVAVINLQGQVFFRNHPLSPFHVLDEILKQPEVAGSHIRLVDFQAEATSEKRALGWYCDGRISALWGTHTHVPTADAQILPKGTGYISDIGMNGKYQSVIGVDQERSVAHFLDQLKADFTITEEGPLEVGALFLEIEPTTGQTTAIKQIRKILAFSR